jgi:pyruvate dehydrogenase E2 component (dihydrolipoamide acetyltransferase)
MPFEIKMPQLGLTMESGTLLAWLVEQGDQIVPGKGIFEVETDKAAVVVEAHEAGVIAEILVQAGESVPVGTTLAVAVGPGESLLADWRSSHPANVAQPRAEPESMAVPRREPTKEGKLRASWKARTIARESNLELSIVVGSGPNGRVVAADVRRAAARGEKELVVETKVSPVAANLAASLGLPLSAIQGSGTQGRILKADVIEAAAAVIRSQAAALEVPQASWTHVRETVPLVGVRGTVSKRMAASAQATARVTLFREVDATALVELREQYVRRDVEVSYNDILVRVCAAALREHPQANARMGDEVIEWLDDVHVGLAVDTDEGLLVPVVHNADELSIPEIGQESARLIEAARTGQCTPDELTGGTFTITNLGMLGVEGFTPVINLPECCILGMGRVVRKPIVCGGNDTVTVRSMMTLSLAFDHRVIDGAPAARFLSRITELVEDPRLLL